MDNRVAEKWSGHIGLTDNRIGEIVTEVCGATGFASSNEEVQRRTIYDPDKTWRVRISGMFEGRPALLRIENLKLERDEEEIRNSFRSNAAGKKVRPPETHAFQAYDSAKGYGWSIDEFVPGPVLFLETMTPTRPARDFGVFYTELRQAVSTAFWPPPLADSVDWVRRSGDGDFTPPTPVHGGKKPQNAHDYTREQFAKWRALAFEVNPLMLNMYASVLDGLQAAACRGMYNLPLQFMHAHLKGTDVRLALNGDYVVFANHFWSWRQPGYDVAVPIWGQWMALPEGHRTPEDVANITETWLRMVRERLASYVSADTVRAMLLNRLFGSLILDIPAKARREGHHPVLPLEQAFLAEAERLLA